VYDLIKLGLPGIVADAQKSPAGHRPVQTTADRFKPIGCRPATQVDEDHIFGV
jgi:hypothetical protein